MNKLIAALTVAIAASLPGAALAQNSWEKDPAYLPIDKSLDLKVIHPEVNVNLPRFLLKDAISELGNGPGQPLAGSGIDLPDLLKDVKLIRVVVIESKPGYREALDKGVKELRAELDSKWTAIVTVPEEKVGVYAKGDPSGESMTGLAVLVANGGDVVIANVVGHVPIGKLIGIASHMHNLPGRGLLQKLQQIGSQNQTGTRTETKPAPNQTQEDKKSTESSDSGREKPVEK